jgi:hypothetical protein
MSIRNELNEKIIERAWKDEAFKEKLLKDPKAALLQMNPNLPDDLKIQVHEESADTIHLVLPRDPAKAALSDQELDAVAGAGGSDTYCDHNCW